MNTPLRMRDPSIGQPRFEAYDHEVPEHVVDGFDPTPREIPAGTEVQPPKDTLILPLGHIANMGDFEPPVSE